MVDDPALLKFKIESALMRGLLAIHTGLPPCGSGKEMQLGGIIMYQESLDFKQHIHLLGVSYVSNFLDRVGFTILEVNTDQNHHYQLFVKIHDKSFLIAIRTDYHPKLGTLDAYAMENLLRESEKLNALPHFAGLAVAPADVNDSGQYGSSEDHMLKVLFSGIRAIRR